MTRLLLMLIITVTTIVILANTALGATWVVDDNGGADADYTNIQEAIDNANAGDSIYVYNGTYNENVLVNKRLTLKGEGVNVVTVTASGNVFKVITDYVDISGFMITGGNCGIYINSDHNNITDTTVSENNEGNPVYGIYLHSSDHNRITENHVDDSHQEYDYFDYGEGYSYGIYLDNSNNNTLINNTASRNIGQGDDECTSLEGIWDYSYGYGYGIYLSNSDDNILIGNIASGNMGEGGMGDPDCYMDCKWWCEDYRMTCEEDCLIEKDMCVEECNGNPECEEDCESSYNICTSDCWDAYENDCLWGCTEECCYEVPGFGYGIYLTSSNNNMLINNTANENQGNDGMEDDGYGCGIYLEYSNENVLTKNTMNLNNEYGIHLYSSSNNTIYNNYLSNTNNAADDGTNIWNTTNTTEPNIIGGLFIGGNYWSDYAGNDINRDGFGEAAYNITGGSNQDHLPLVLVHEICGDIDGNMIVNAADLQLLLAHIFAGIPIADECIGDVDGSGSINILDIRLLMSHIAYPGGYSLNCTCGGVRS